MSIAIFDNVTKVYNKRAAVKNISLQIERGEIFGLIGPNGAGKTTLIKMAAGLIKPTEGDVYIDGASVRFDIERSLEKIGGIIENPEMFRSMSGLDNLKYFAMLSGGITNERIEQIVRLVKLENRIKDKVKAYSLGMRQRLGIAQALLHRPKLLLLDEPTNGLDPSGIKDMRNVFLHLSREEGVATIISSHILKEMELLVDRFAIMNNGQILSINKSGDLAYTQKHISLSSTDNESALALLAAEYPDGGACIENDELRVFASGEESKKIVRLLIKNDIDINFIKVAERSLEDFYIASIGDAGAIQ